MTNQKKKDNGASSKNNKASPKKSKLTVPQSPNFSTTNRAARVVKPVRLSATTLELQEIAKEKKAIKAERERTKAYRMATQMLPTVAGKKAAGKENDTQPVFKMVRNFIAENDFTQLVDIKKCSRCSRGSRY